MAKEAARKARSNDAEAAPAVPAASAGDDTGAKDTGEAPAGGDPSAEAQQAQDAEGPVRPAEDGQRAAWLDWIRGRVDTDRKALIVVLVAGILLFIPYLGTLGLWDPWETRGGEVARAMVARDDYVYPYWESAYFFSKPALPLWLMALGIFVTGSEHMVPPGEPLGGLAEWGIRMPFALIAILTMWAVYRIGSRLRDRTTGLVAAFVLASCPQFVFIGKQAMTDGPLVGFMTAGIALFMLAVFDEEDDAPASKGMKIATAIGIALAVFPQLFLVGRELRGGQDYIGLMIGGAIGVGFIAGILAIGTRRDCWLAGFYTFVGLAALSKGLAVLAVLGPVVVLYMLLTLDFRILARCKVYIGWLLFLLVASPWYVALTLFKGRDDEGLTFTQRFWMHDNFSRVGAGVHGDRAGMGYYIEQLAYGMFPWSVTLPMALGLAARGDLDEATVQRRRAVLFVLIWGLWCYAFFTISQTKFHHYIYPAVPAFAVLVSLWVMWIADRPKDRIKLALGLVMLVIFAVVARDLINDPKNLVNLFTYKYDRPFPREMNPRIFMIPILVGGGLVTAALYNRKRPDLAVLSFCVMAGLFAAWLSHHHFNMLSPHWSQAHLFKTYYDERTGDEPIYAYQLNWRGETYYSRNRVLQVKEKGANQRIRTLVDQPGREFIVTEQSRFHTLKNALAADKRPKLQILDRSSNKFYLCVVEE